MNMENGLENIESGGEKEKKLEEKLPTGVLPLKEGDGIVKVTIITEEKIFFIEKEHLDNGGFEKRSDIKKKGEQEIDALIN